MYNKRMQPLEVNRTFNSTPLLTVNNYYCPGTSTDCSTNNGNVQSQWIARNGSATPWVQSFGYDGVNRLSQAAETLGQGGTQSWQEAYGYDAYGNRSIASSTFTWSAMTPPGFDPATNRNSGGGWSPATSYDSVGNVTADPMGGAYQYDAENRMVSANGTTYQYDGEGRRVSKSGGGATTTYLYDAAGQLLTEYGAVTAASGTQYVGVDGLGSTRLLTDASGNLPPAGGCHDYLPFGTELTQGMAGNRGSCFGGTDGVEEKFTGKERDAETGLDFFEARYLSSAQGRFTSPDAIGGHLEDPQTLNRYAYVRNNPLRFTDPTGLDFWLQGGDACGKNGVTCDKKGFVTDSKGGRVLVGNDRGIRGRATKLRNGSMSAPTVACYPGSLNLAIHPVAPSRFSSANSPP
jgi:RHS repeat-associated protein